MANNELRMGQTVYVVFEGEKKPATIIGCNEKLKYYTLELANKDHIYRFAEDIEVNDRSEWISSWAMAFRHSLH